MPTAFDGLPRAGFYAIKFPITHLSIKGSGRQHIHEYPHSAGGQPEKLGRKLYTIKMRALFYDVFATYGDLYPTAMNSLIIQFEQQLTGPLVIPTVGTIQAFCTEWPREADFSKIRSGEVMDLEFLEDPGDQSQSFLSQNLGQGAAASIATAVLMAPSYPTASSSLLQSIQNSINSVLAIEQQVDLYGTYLSNQVTGILALFDEFDSSPAMQNPANYPLMTVVHDAAALMVQYQKSLTTKQGTPMKYRVPHVMSVSQVSTAIFGSSSQAVTILEMNALDDAMAIPAGTQITYLSTTGTSS